MRKLLKWILLSFIVAGMLKISVAEENEGIRVKVVGYGFSVVGEDGYSLGQGHYGQAMFVLEDGSSPVLCGNGGLLSPFTRKAGNEAVNKMGSTVSLSESDYEDWHVEEEKDEMIRKIIYYGWKGPEEWKCFGNKYDDEGNRLDIYIGDNVVGYGYTKALDEYANQKDVSAAIITQSAISAVKNNKEAYFDGYDVRGVKAFIEYVNKNDKKLPDGFHVYALRTGNDLQDFYWYVYEPIGQLKLHKKISCDEELVRISEEYYSLENCEYEVRDENDELQGILKTDVNGYSNTLILKTGRYYLKEIKAPKGYRLNEKVIELEINEDETVEIDAEDEPVFSKGEILLIKKDAATEEGIKGIKFEVSYYSDIFSDVKDISSHETKRKWIFETDNEGKIDLNDPVIIDGELFKDHNNETVLLNGSYYFREIEEDNGYISSDPFIINIDINNNVIFKTPVIENIHKGYLKILKTADNEEYVINYPLTGTEFVLCYDRECKNVLHNIIINNDNESEVLELEPGTYYLKEVKTTEGYQLSDKIYEIIIEPWQLNEKTILNMINPEIKTFASFENGKKMCSERKKIIDTVKISNLIPGREYQLVSRLIDADSNVIMDEISKSFISDSDEMEMKVEFINKYENKKLCIIQSLYYQDKLISEHTDLKDEDQTVYMPYISTSANCLRKERKYEYSVNDSISYSHLMKGKYLIVTSLVDRNSKETLKVIKNEVNINDENGTVDISFDLSEFNEREFVIYEQIYSDEELLLEHCDISDENQMFGTEPVDYFIKVVKEDEKTGKKLKNCEIGLFENDKLIESQFTDEEGKAIFHVIYGNEYQVREITAPEGYKISEEIYEIVIDHEYDFEEPIVIIIKDEKEEIVETGDENNVAKWLNLFMLSSLISVCTLGNLLKRKP